MVSQISAQNPQPPPLPPEYSHGGTEKRRRRIFFPLSLLGATQDSTKSSN